MKNCHTVLPSVELLNELFIYDPETGILTNRIERHYRSLKGAEAGNLSKDGYRRVRINCRLHLVHRVIFTLINSGWPENEVDHISGDKSDNRACNLREASHSQNMSNRKNQKNNKSGFKGVSWIPKRGKWWARVSFQNKTFSLGYFDNPNDAAKAYDEGAGKIHGEFARRPI